MNNKTLTETVGIIDGTFTTITDGNSFESPFVQCDNRFNLMTLFTLPQAIVNVDLLLEVMQKNMETGEVKTVEGKSINYNVSDFTGVVKFPAVNFRPSDLDVNNGFDCIGYRVSASGGDYTGFFGVWGMFAEYESQNENNNFIQWATESNV